MSFVPFYSPKVFANVYVHSSKAKPFKGTSFCIGFKNANIKIESKLVTYIIIFHFLF